MITSPSDDAARAISAFPATSPAVEPYQLPGLLDLPVPPLWRGSKNGLRFNLYLALLTADIASLVLAFALGNLVRTGNVVHYQGLDMLVVLLPVFLAIALTGQCYSIAALKRPGYGIRRAIRSFILAMVVVIGIIFYLKASEDFSRVITAVASLSAILLLAGSRWLIGKAAGRSVGWNFNNEALLLDDPDVLPSLSGTVVYADALGLSPSDDPVVLDRLGQLLRHCDRLVIACSAARREAWAALLKGVDVNVEILAPEMDKIGALGVGRFNRSSTLLVSRGPLPLRDQAIKRGFDLFLAVPAIIITAPVLLAIALAIKAESRGPVFFRQRRIGLCNRMFYIYKFRTMHVEHTDAEASRLTLPGDARVTKVGDFLRKTSLDELPQLINVLLGDMSIVGPRPHATGALAGESLYWEVDGRYWHRHAVKPGITGLAQVRGFRGNTVRHEDLSNRLQSDLEYLTGWSIWRDLSIVAATFKVMVHHNAY